MLLVGALVAVQHVCAPPAQASGGGLPPAIGEGMAGFSLGILGTAGILLAYGVAGVEFDGILVPPTLGWVQLGVSTATWTTLLVVGAEATVAVIAVATAAPLLALHAVWSILGYEAPRQDDARRPLSLGLATYPSDANSLSLVWRGFL